MEKFKPLFREGRPIADDGKEYAVLVRQFIWEGARRTAVPHVHKEIEMIYVLSGDYEAVLDGQAYRFSQGDLLIINSEEVHDLSSLSEGESSYIMTRFAPDILYSDGDTLLEAQFVRPFTLRTSGYQKVFTKAELDNTFLPELMLENLLECTEMGYCFDLAIRSNICKMFLWILRHWREQGVDLGNNADLTEQAQRQLRQVLEYVNEHYMAPIAVEEMARMCSMSYHYFSRFFKKTMHINFTTYLNGIRIKQAEKLLVETDKTMTDIAMEVGFATSSYFIEQFRKIKGMPPMQFRKTFGK